MRERKKGQIKKRKERGKKRVCKKIRVIEKQKK